MSVGKKIEQEVRDILSKKLRASLSEQRLVIGYRADKTPQYHRFDIVSDDKKIIGEVKSYKLSNETTGKAGYTSTRKARLLAALFYLTKVKAQTKLLVLTNKELFEQFNRDMEGLLNPNIKIVHVGVK